MLNPILSERDILDLWVAAGRKKEEMDCSTAKAHCPFWAGVWDKERLIALGSLATRGLMFGYINALVVHLDYQDQHVDEMLLQYLLEVAERSGTEIVAVATKVK